MMERITQMKIPGMVRVTNKRVIQRYIKDPYFVKKREMASAFLKKVGLPKLCKKSQAK
ncbi:hypothetical protein GGD38_006853 [Chitinophagaceae bacterium OAS944]|nr:hypothetical protein [Chitinophagaceae bacterium OAS944]